MTALGFAGFIAGLAGKSVAVKKQQRKKNEFYQVITVVSLVVLLISVILYALI